MFEDFEAARYRRAAVLSIVTSAVESFVLLVLMTIIIHANNCYCLLTVLRIQLGRRRTFLELTTVN